MSDDITHLKALRAKASPGVWESVPSFEGAATADIMRENANLSTGDDYIFVDSEGLRGCALVEDAEYVAALHNALPELIAELERHRAFVQALVANSDRGICPVCSYLWQECECGVDAARYHAEAVRRLSGLDEFHPDTSWNVGESQ